MMGILHNKILYIAVAVAILPAFCREGDAAGEWHDPEGFEGRFSEECHVETSSTDRTREDGTHEITLNETTTDSEGNQQQFSVTEVKRPDNTVTSHQEVTYTNKYGVQTKKTMTWEYDKDGNITRETHSTKKSRVEKPLPPDEGLEVEEVTDPGTSEKSTCTTTYGRDKAKRKSPESEVIYDLKDEELYQVSHSSKEYFPGSLYFCLEYTEAVREEYGSMEAYCAAVVASAIKALEGIPGGAAKLGKDLAKSIEQLQEARSRIFGGSITPEGLMRPEDLTCEFTDKVEIAAGYPAELVVIKNRGRRYKEIWLALHVNVMGVLDNKNIPQKAKDYMFVPYPLEPTPRIRRAFSRLKVKETTFGSWGKSVKIVRGLQRKKLKPDEFRIPEDYSKGARLEPKAIIRLPEVEQGNNPAE